MSIESQDRAPAYSTLQVCHLIPVTARQLQWWDETEILSPALVGHSRQYSPADLFGVALIHELKQRDFSIQQLRGVRKLLSKQNFELPTDQHKWLLTNGERVVLLSHPNMVIAFLEQRRSPAFVLISLEAISKSLADRQTKLRQPLKKGPERARKPIEVWLEERRAQEA